MKLLLRLALVALMTPLWLLHYGIRRHLFKDTKWTMQRSVDVVWAGDPFSAAAQRSFAREKRRRDLPEQLYIADVYLEYGCIPHARHEVESYLQSHPRDAKAAAIMQQIDCAACVCVTRPAVVASLKKLVRYEPLSAHARQLIAQTTSGLEHTFVEFRRYLTHYPLTWCEFIRYWADYTLLLHGDPTIPFSGQKENFEAFLIGVATGGSLPQSSRDVATAIDCGRLYQFQQRAST